MMISLSAPVQIAGETRAIFSRRLTSCEPRPYPALIHWKASIIFRERGRRRGGGRHIAELGQLAALIERHLVGEAVEDLGHPPGEALRLPDARQTGLRVAVEQIAPVRPVKGGEC